MTTVRTRAAILAGIALLFAVGTRAQEGAQRKPKAVVPAPVFDAGTVQKGNKVVHDFEVINEGDADLEIREVNPACGCTVASFDRVIPPGGTGDVHLELDTTAFTGPLSKAATVLTNDPALASFQLTIQVTVKPVIQVKPGYARYIFVQGAAPGTIAQTLWAEDGQDFQVVRATTPYPFLKTSFREATEAERLPQGKGRQWRVETTIASDAAVGALKDNMVIETTHPKQSEVLVPLSGFVRPLFVLTPPVLDFGELTVTEEKAYSAVFVNYGEAPIAVHSVEVTVPGMTAQIKELEAGHRFRLSLTVSPAMGKGPFAGTLRIATNSTQIPLFEAAVRGTVK